MHEQWKIPKVLNDIDVVCPENITDKLMPPYEEIPEDFRRERGEAKKWISVVDDWFFSGIKDVRITVKNKEIDQKHAVRHLQAIVGSYKPKHEYKTAGAAYLMSLWFEDVTYKVGTHD